MAAPNSEILRDPICIANLSMRMQSPETGDNWVRIPQLMNFNPLVNPMRWRQLPPICTAGVPKIHRPAVMNVCLSNLPVAMPTHQPTPRQYEFARLNLNYTVTKASASLKANWLTRARQWLGTTTACPSLSAFRPAVVTTARVAA